MKPGPVLPPRLIEGIDDAALRDTLEECQTMRESYRQSRMAGAIVRCAQLSDLIAAIEGEIAKREARNGA